MTKKGRIAFQIYSCLLIFLLTFFTIYAFRYDVFVIIDGENYYRTTLTSKEKEDITGKLNELELGSNNHHAEIDAVFEPYKSEFRFHLAYVVEVPHNGEIVEGISQFNMTSPMWYKDDLPVYENDVIIQHKDGKMRLFAYPTFHAYIQLYSWIAGGLSVLVCVFFLLLYNRIKSRKVFQKATTRIHHRWSKKVVPKLSSQLIMVNLIVGLVALSCFFYMYINRYAYFEFLQENVTMKTNMDAYVEDVQEKVRDVEVTKKNKEQLIKFLNEGLPSNATSYLSDAEGVYFVGSNSSQSIDKQMRDNDAFKINGVTFPVYRMYNLRARGELVQLNIYEYPLIPYVNPYMIAIVLLSISLYILPLLIFIRKKVYRIKKLQEDVVVLSTGDWNHSVSSSGNDEISDLGENLNAMRVSFLESSEKEKEARIANKELIAAMSHDLRTPLTALNGYLEIIELQKGDPKLYEEYIKRSLEKVEEIKDLSNKMLSYALVYDSEEETTMSTIVYQEWFAIIKENVDFISLKGFAVDFTSALEEGTIHGNVQLLKRIFNNVFNNVYKYGDKEKPIKVTCKREKEYIEVMVFNVKREAIEMVESNRIGLKSVAKMMEMQEGKYFVYDESNAFSIKLLFKIEECEKER